MTNETRRKATITVLIVFALIGGLVGGYFIPHQRMSGMPATAGKPNQEAAKETPAMKDMPGMGQGGVSAPPGRAGEMKGMQEMPGMSSPTTPPGAVVLPAVQRQLIGVRTGPVKYAPLGQDIRAVGTIVYDERTLTQVNLRISGWIKEVFVDSVGKPV